MKIILSKFLPDVYNGKKAVSWWSFKNDISCYISYDRKTWEAIGTKKLPGFELMTEFTMKEDSVFVARMPPYTISDLENLKKRISKSNLVSIYNIGKTAEQRPLEIIRLGDLNAPHHIIIRARAHPWEAGGNWVTEGLINEFISRNNPVWQKTFCIHIMPMANKDGVARGTTRFNLKGKDLNRNWDKMSDPELCPEKYVFERYIQELAEKDIIPVLGIDFHNDDF
jgi:murein tripeptide amidase MpaA